MAEDDDWDIPLPTIQLALRSKQGLQFLAGDQQIFPIQEQHLQAAGSLAYSADAAACAVIANTQQVIVYSIQDESYQELAVIERENVHAIHLSPKHKFLVTWEKQAGTRKKSVELKEQEEEEEVDNVQVDGNLIVWNVQTREIHARFFQKTYKPESWPYLTWSDDEFLAMRLVTNEVHFFDGQDISRGIQRKLHLPKVQKAVFAPIINGTNCKNPKSSYFIATHSPGSKGSPAKASIYDYPLLQCCSSKSFFNADSVEISWSFNGEIVLIKGIAEVQKDSYYGSAQLFLISRKGEALNVSGSSSESSRMTVADVQWSPAAKEFVLIYGRSATLHTGKDAEILFDFGSSHWNTVRWNPQGTFIMLGGFGNMAGDFKIWDRDSLKEIGNGNAHGSKFFEWAPDGLRLLTASIFPWRRVDNELKIWKFSGELLQWLKFDELYQVAPRTFMDPNHYKFPEMPSKYIKKLANQAKKKVKQASKPFVPIHLRSAIAEGKASNESSKLLHHDDPKPKHVPPASKVTTKLPVGMTPAMANAIVASAEPKKRRRRKKKAASGDIEEEDDE